MGLAGSYISTMRVDKEDRLIALANYRGICIFGVLPASSSSFYPRIHAYSGVIID